MLDPPGNQTVSITWGGSESRESECGTENVCKLCSVLRSGWPRLVNRIVSGIGKKLVAINGEHLNRDFRKFFKLQMRRHAPTLTEIAYALPERY